MAATGPKERRGARAGAGPGGVGGVGAVAAKKGWLHRDGGGEPAVRRVAVRGVAVHGTGIAAGQ